MNMKKSLLPCIALAVVSLLAHTTQAQTIVAHRGLFLQPGEENAENTLPAFVQAFLQGYSAVELDIRVTSDGTAVIMHDNAVDPNTGVNANFAGFSPQRTTNWDGLSAGYSPFPFGAFSLIDYPGYCYLINCTLPLNPSLADMLNKVSYFKIYDQAGNIIGTQPIGVLGYDWELQQVLEYLRGYPEIIVVLDIQSVEALAAAEGVVARLLPPNPIVFKVWTTALSESDGIPSSGLNNIPAVYRNLVVSDNMIERPASIPAGSVQTNDGTQTVLFAAISTKYLPNLKGMEYFLKGDSTDYTILSDIEDPQNPGLQKWGVLRRYDFNRPSGAAIYNPQKGQSWTCQAPYLIGTTNLCYLTANTGKYSATLNTQVQANLDLLEEYPFDYITEDVYAPHN